MKADSILCVRCGTLLDSRCAGLKSLIPKFSRHLAFRKCAEIIGEAVEKKFYVVKIKL